MADTNLSQLVINELTKTQYEALTPVSNQLYITTDEGIEITDVNGLQTSLSSKVNTSDVINNVTSTETTKPLSANMGKTLQEQITNLKNIGRFLAILDSSAGTVSSQPSGSVGDTYDYKVGDYYRIGNSGTYTPKGTATFTIDSTSGSSNFETGSTTYNIGDVLYCSNLTSTTSTWVKQSSSGGGTVQDVQVDSTSVLSGGIANITLSSFGITATSTELNYTDGVTSNIQTQLNAKPDDLSDLGVTATSSELNVLDGITATTTELNYCDGVTSAIQTQLDAKLTANTAITAGTSSKVTFDTKGLITAFASLLAADIPGVAYTTTTPTAANTDGMKFAVLSTAPATKYDGWFYVITSA